MRIEELEKEQKIVIQVQIGDQTLEFPSQVLESLPKEHGIYATAVRKEEKILSFRGKGISTHLCAYFTDKKPHIFHNVAIQNIKQSDDFMCHLITCLSPSMEFNRRSAFRCFLGFQSVARVGLNQASYEVILRDISQTGFSFVLHKEEEPITNGAVIHTVLNDYLDETAETFTFQLYGLVVRRQELENGKVVYGCILNNRVPGLEAYIMVKERLKLQRERRR